MENTLEATKDTIVFSHQPPDSGSIPASLEERWKEIRSDPNHLASIHGHVHNFHYTLEDKKTHIYVADRVNKGNYGILKMVDGELFFYNCDENCVIANKGN
jgi:calcineurin-like phosphoesterase family protein